MKFKIKRQKLSNIIKFLNLNLNLKKDIIISNISNIDVASKGDISFCINSKYLNFLKKTKASACIISKNFLKFIPKNCIAIISENPQIDFIKISNLFYKDHILDKISKNFLKFKEIKKKFKKISFGNNFICEDGVKIG